jgi:two-component sensor histidine kinase
MDIYEVLDTESRIQEKLARKLVDSTSAQPHIREQLLHEISIRFDLQQAVREEFVYPMLRITAGRQDLVEEYQGRISSIRDHIEKLQGLPKDSDGDFQNSAEVLNQEIDSLTSWEIHEVMPVMWQFLSDDEAAACGDQALAMEDQYQYAAQGL